MNELYIPFVKSKEENISVDKTTKCINIIYMKTPDLSIIIPAYNCEHCIGACLDSIFYQKMADTYDVIVINDGSTDKTGYVIMRYQEKHPNITLINQKNTGVSAARNTGINIATGKYITFVDADDTVGVSYSCVEEYLNGKNDYRYNGLRFKQAHFKTMPDFQPVYEQSYFTRMIKMAEQFNADLVLANKITLNKEQKYINWLGYNKFMYSGAQDKPALLIDADKRESANFALYHRDFLNKENLRFNTAMSLDEDILFCMQAVLRAKQVIMVPKSNYLYNRYYGTASNIKDKKTAQYKYTIATIQRYSVLLSELKEKPEWEELYNMQLKEFARAGNDAVFEYNECFARKTCMLCPCDKCENCYQRQMLDKQIAKNIKLFLEKHR